MDVKEKVIKALRSGLQLEEIQLEDDDRLIGFVVSPQFRGMTALDRQKMIDCVLRRPEANLTKTELRHILMISALTPAEFASVNPLSRSEP